jgi:hypothetical protein
MFTGTKEEMTAPTPPPGELHLPVDAGLVVRAVIVVESPGKVRAKDPVLHGEVAEL